MLDGRYPRRRGPSPWDPKTLAMGTCLLISLGLNYRLFTSSASFRTEAAKCHSAEQSLREVSEDLKEQLTSAARETTQTKADLETAEDKHDSCIRQKSASQEKIENLEAKYTECESNAKNINKKLENAEDKNERLLNQIEALQDESDKNLKSKIEIEAAMATVQNETKEQIAELKDLIAAKDVENKMILESSTLANSSYIDLSQDTDDVSRQDDGFDSSEIKDDSSSQIILPKEIPLIESYNEADSQLVSIENDLKEEKSENLETGDTAIEYNDSQTTNDDLIIDNGEVKTEGLLEFDTVDISKEMEE